MLNLEWFRSFRAVYTTGSISKAAKNLSLSQPAVTQHIQALEARLGRKLFVRKSKGVAPTDSGRSLSNMVAASIEKLEEVESAIIENSSPITKVVKLGISRHLFKSVIGNSVHEIGSVVHITYGDRQTLIKETEKGNLLYSIIPGSVNTFDLICHHLFDQYLVLLGTPDVDFKHFHQLMQRGEDQMAEDWLTEQIWYSHNTGGDFIKHYWLNIFNKKRPSIVPNYVIPNEYETLDQQVKGTGISIAFETTAQPFIESKQLIVCRKTKVKMRDIVLICNKQNSNPDITQRLVELCMSGYKTT